MKVALAALAILGLTGCSSDPASSVAKGIPANPVCSAVAADRASDAVAARVDDQTQHDVFDRAYSDCVAWRLAHGN